jgi:hypothetical protein
MKRNLSQSKQSIAALALAALLALAGRASACAVCMGSDNPQTVEASNTVLWTLLGLVGFIFVATGLTVLFIWMHGRR